MVDTGDKRRRDADDTVHNVRTLLNSMRRHVHVLTSFNPSDFTHTLNDAVEVYEIERIFTANETIVQSVVRYKRQLHSSAQAAFIGIPYIICSITNH